MGERRTKKAGTNIEMVDVHLPDGILHGILARLSAKPLLLSRCVSKRWNRLISDPYFMRFRSCRKMLLVSPPLYILDGTVPVDYLAHPTGRLHYLFETESDVDVRIIGTFNGIVLLLVHDPNVECMMGYYIDQLILYNPFTGKSKNLPDPYSPSGDYHSLYGFCYGETLDDLMIVRFRDYTRSSKHIWKTCDVFNLKTSLWSTSEIPIQGANFSTRLRGQIGIFVNGFLYWIASNKIVAFSVKEMVVSEISLPVPDHMEIKVGTFHGRLCMITHKNDSFDHKFNVWVMNEHGVKDPWSIAHSFELPYKVRCLSVSRVINTMDDGRILVVNSLSNECMIFDTLKHSYKMLNISPRFINDAHAIEYDESLVLPWDICGV